jgi:hypothetical protein
MGTFLVLLLSYLDDYLKNNLNLYGLLHQNRKVCIFTGASLFSNTYAQVTMDASNDTMNGAVTNFTIGNSVLSISNIAIGASTSACGDTSSSGNTSGNTSVNSNSKKMNILDTNP